MENNTSEGLSMHPKYYKIRAFAVLKKKLELK
jgi:hypothetical protein